jgi:hypothetical protein
MSSSGNASSETAPHVITMIAPSGAHQPLGRRTAALLGFSSPVSATERTPAASTPKRPARMK